MRTLLLSLLLLAVTATGCAGGTSAGDDVSTAAPVPEPTATLPDGEHVGFLVAVTTDPATITVDPATWVADDTEPNGYRIEDPGLDPVDLVLADDADVEVLRSTGDPSTAEAVDVEGLQAWFTDLGQPDGGALFDVVVDDGEVTALRFRYRP